MDNDTVVEQIVRSLSFEVVAIPQDVIQVDHTTKSTPVNVKIRVRKKANTGLPDSVISLSKMDRKDYPPGRVRLVSSDQTIMSFNVVMDNEYNQNLMLQPGSSYKADVAACSDLQSDGVMKNKFTLSKKDKLTASSFLSKRNKDIFGRCKPGGCLDPPFGEDRYSYKPAKRTPSPIETPTVPAKGTTTPVKGLIMPAKETTSSIKVSIGSSQGSTSPVKGSVTTSVADESNRTRSSSIFKINPFKKKRKSDQADELLKTESDSPTKTDSVLQLYQTGSLQGSTYSNTIITYPPTTNTSDQQVQEHRHSKIRYSSDERSSTGSYFIVPKKAKKQVDQSTKKTQNEGIGDNELNKTEDLHDPQKTTLLKTASEPKISDKTNLTPLLIPLALPLLSGVDGLIQDDENKQMQANASLAQNLDGINVSEGDESQITKISHSVEGKDLIAENNDTSLNNEGNNVSFTRDHHNEELQQLQQAQETELIFLKNVNDLDETKTNRADLTETMATSIINNENNGINKHVDGQVQLLSPVIQEKSSLSLTKDDYNTNIDKRESIRDNDGNEQDIKDGSSGKVTGDSLDNTVSEPVVDEYNVKIQSVDSYKIIFNPNVIKENYVKNANQINDLENKIFLDRKSIENDQNIQYLSETIITPLKSEADSISFNDYVKKSPKDDDRSQAEEYQFANDDISGGEERSKDLDPNKTNKKLPSNDIEINDNDLLSDRIKEMPPIMKGNTSYESTYKMKRGEEVKGKFGQSPDTTQYNSEDKNLNEPLQSQKARDVPENFTNSYNESSNIKVQELSSNKGDTHDINIIKTLITSPDEKGLPNTFFDSKPKNVNIEGNRDQDNNLDVEIVTTSNETKKNVLDKEFIESLADTQQIKVLGIKAVKHSTRFSGIEISERDNLINPKADPTPILRGGHISSSVVQKDVGPWKVDLALHSYINEQNERVLKSFDSDNVPDQYQNDALIIAKCALENDSSSIKVPLDSKNELIIEIKNNRANQPLTDVYDNEAEESHTAPKQKKIKINAPGDEVENTDYHVNKSEAKRRVVNDDNNLRDALISIYERELVPLQDVIKGLREEIDMLSSYRMMLYEKSDTKRWKPQRLAHGNRRCGCSRRL